MSEHLLKAGGSAGERPVEEGVRLPHLRAWFRTRSAIILHLSNGIMQVCTHGSWLATGFSEVETRPSRARLTSEANCLVACVVSSFEN